MEKCLCELSRILGKMDIKQELMKAATSMGYRKMAPRRDDSLWGKPLGWTLLTLDLEKVELIQWFYSGREQIEMWSRNTYNPLEDGEATTEQIKEKLINWIKDFEDWHIHEHGFSLPVRYNFEFITRKEILDLELD